MDTNIIIRTTIFDGTIVEFPAGCTLVYGRDVNGNMSITVNAPMSVAASAPIPHVAKTAVPPVVKAPKAPAVNTETSETDEDDISNEEETNNTVKVNAGELFGGFKANAFGNAFFADDDEEESEEEDKVVVIPEAVKINNLFSDNVFADDDDNEEEETTVPEDKEETKETATDKDTLSDEEIIDAVAKIIANYKKHIYPAYMPTNILLCKQGDKATKAAIAELAKDCGYQVGLKFVDFLSEIMIPYNTTKGDGLYIPAETMARVYHDKTLYYGTVGKNSNRMFLIVNGVPYKFTDNGKKKVGFETIDDAIRNGECVCTSRTSDLTSKEVK